MLADVRRASDKYQSEYEKIHKTFLAKIQELSVDKEMRQILEIKLELSKSRSGPCNFYD